MVCVWGVYVYTGICEGQRLFSGVSFSQSLLVFSRQLLEHSNLSRLAAWWAPGTLLSLPPQH